MMNQECLDTAGKMVQRWMVKERRRGAEGKREIMAKGGAQIGTRKEAGSVVLVPSAFMGPCELELARQAFMFSYLDEVWILKLPYRIHDTVDTSLALIWQLWKFGGAMEV